MEKSKEIISQNMVNIWTVIFDEVKTRKQSGLPVDYESVVLKSLGIRGKRFEGIPDLTNVDITEDLVRDWIYSKMRKKSIELRRSENKDKLDAISLQGEEWRPTVGFSNYMVSNMGRVYSLRGGSIMKPFFHSKDTKKRKSDTYPSVGLTDDFGKAKHRWIHRLVAQAFIPNPEGKDTVDHINEDHTDNRAENLRWATLKENCEYYMTNHGIEYNPNAWWRHAYEPHKMTPPPSDNPREEWRNIPDWPDHFISSDGRVWSAYRAQFISYNGKRVTLQSNGKKLSTTVKTLMATTFLPKPAPGMVLRFKNGDNSDLRLDNLEWHRARQKPADRGRLQSRKVFL